MLLIFIDREVQSQDQTLLVYTDTKFRESALSASIRRRRSASLSSIIDESSFIAFMLGTAPRRAFPA